MSVSVSGSARSHLLTPTIGVDRTAARSYRRRNSGATWPSRSRIALALSFVLLLLSATHPTAALAKGGYGLVTLNGVGPLSFDNSTDVDVRAWAGRPDKVQWSTDGFNDGMLWRTFIYRFPRGGVVEYSFYLYPGEGWYFEEFHTTLERFRTRRGTRVGMSYTQARRREGVPESGGCIGGGFWHHEANAGLLVATDNARTRVIFLDAQGPEPLPC